MVAGFMLWFAPIGPFIPAGDIFLMADVIVPVSFVAEPFNPLYLNVFTLDSLALSLSEFPP
jgi:hypothetical protein